MTYNKIVKLLKAYSEDHDNVWVELHLQDDGSGDVASPFYDRTFFVFLNEKEFLRKITKK
jgi:hypothetical protein